MYDNSLPWQSGLRCPPHFASATGGPEIDPGIAQQIAAIWAVDNHAHPVLAPPLDKTDREFDAFPATSLEPQSDPVALAAGFSLAGSGMEGAVWVRHATAARCCRHRAFDGRARSSEGTTGRKLSCVGAWTRPKLEPCWRIVSPWAEVSSRRDFAGYLMWMRCCFRSTTAEWQRYLQIGKFFALEDQVRASISSKWV